MVVDGWICLQSKAHIKQLGRDPRSGAAKIYGKICSLDGSRVLDESIPDMSDYHQPIYLGFVQLGGIMILMRLFR